MEYDWPGNIRELLNVIERACSFGEGEFIQIEDISPNILQKTHEAMRKSKDEGNGSNPPYLTTKTYKETKDESEKEYLIQLLNKNNFNITKAAKEADIDRKRFYSLLKKHSIDVKKNISLKNKV